MNKQESITKFKEKINEIERIYSNIFDYDLNKIKRWKESTNLAINNIFKSDSHKKNI